MKNFFGNHKFIRIHQIKEMAEILIDWETANRYEVLDHDKNIIGYAAEREAGFWAHILRNIMRSHRTLTIGIWDNTKKLVMTGIRPFFFFFSDLVVSNDKNEKIGEIKTRFGFLKRKYDLLDSNGSLFAKIESYRWRLWTFTVYDTRDYEVGVITKEWGGLLKESFSDSDNFAIDLSKQTWTDEQKAILLFACLSIDLDFFEDNSSSGKHAASTIFDVLKRR